MFTQLPPTYSSREAGLWVLRASGELEAVVATVANGRPGAGRGEDKSENEHDAGIPKCPMANASLGGLTWHHMESHECI